MISERDIQAEIWEALTPHAVMFRNNVGVCMQKIPNRNASQYIRFGLCPGSSDLIGWTPVVVTEDMVGKTVAVFTALEIKTKTGKASKKQLYFIGRVQGDGGYAGIAREVEDALDIVKGDKT